MTLRYLQGESQVYVFHLLVEVGFLPFYEQRLFELQLVFSSCRVQGKRSPVCRMFGKTLNSADVSKRSKTCRKVSAHALGNKFPLFSSQDPNNTNSLYGNYAVPKQLY